jgi:hypothetical protein
MSLPLKRGSAARAPLPWRLWACVVVSFNTAFVVMMMAAVWHKRPLVFAAVTGLLIVQALVVWIAVCSRLTTGR